MYRPGSPGEALWRREKSPVEKGPQFWGWATMWGCDENSSCVGYNFYHAIACVGQALVGDWCRDRALSLLGPMQRVLDSDFTYITELTPLCPPGNTCWLHASSSSFRSLFKYFFLRTFLPTLLTGRKQTLLEGTQDSYVTYIGRCGLRLSFIWLLDCLHPLWVSKHQGATCCLALVSPASLVPSMWHVAWA